LEAILSENTRELLRLNPGKKAYIIDMNEWHTAWYVGKDIEISVQTTLSTIHAEQVLNGIAESNSEVRVKKQFGASDRTLLEMAGQEAIAKKCGVVCNVCLAGAVLERTLTQCQATDAHLSTGHFPVEHGKLTMLDRFRTMDLTRVLYGVVQFNIEEHGVVCHDATSWIGNAAYAGRFGAGEIGDKEAFLTEVKKTRPGLLRAIESLDDPALSFTPTQPKMLGAGFRLEVPEADLALFVTSDSNEKMKENAKRFLLSIIKACDTFLHPDFDLHELAYICRNSSCYPSANRYLPMGLGPDERMDKVDFTKKLTGTEPRWFVIAKKERDNFHKGMRAIAKVFAKIGE
jgi:hypothetical protein